MAGRQYMVICVGWSRPLSRCALFSGMRYYCSNISLKDRIEEAKVGASPISSFHKLLEEQIQARQWDSVSEIFSTATKENISLPPPIYEKLLFGLVKEKETSVEDLTELITTIPAKTPRLFNITLKKIIQSQNPEIFQSLMTLMVRCNVEPNTETLRWIALGYVKINDIINAEKTFKDNIFSIPPTEEALLPILKYHRNKGNEKKISEWIHWMYNNEVPLTGKTYSELLYLFLRNQQIDQAYDLVKRLEKAKVELPLTAYTIIISHFANSKTQKPLKTFLQDFKIKEEYLVPVHLALINAFRKFDQQLVLIYIEKLMALEKSIPYFGVHFVPRNGNYGVDLIQRLRDRGTEISPLLYNKVLCMLIQENNKKTSQFVQLALRDKIAIPLDTLAKYCGTLISGEHGISLCISFMDQLITTNVVTQEKILSELFFHLPPSISYSHVVLLWDFVKTKNITLFDEGYFILLLKVIKFAPADKISHISLLFSYLCSNTSILFSVGMIKELVSAFKERDLAIPSEMMANFVPVLCNEGLLSFAASLLSMCGDEPVSDETLQYLFDKMIASRYYVEAEELKKKFPSLCGASPPLGDIEKQQDIQRAIGKSAPMWYRTTTEKMKKE